MYKDVTAVSTSRDRIKQPKAEHLRFEMEHAHLADCPPLPQRKREKETQKRKNACSEKTTSTARLIAAHKGRCNRHDTLINSF
jgi:hypothetical protein